LDPSGFGTGSREKEYDYEALLASQEDKAVVDLTSEDDDVAHLYYTSGTTGVLRESC